MVKALSATVAGIVLVLVLGTGTTFAQWSDTASLPAAGTVRAGGLGLTIGGSTTYTVGDVGVLYPGRTTGDSWRQYPGAVRAFRIPFTTTVSGNLGMRLSLTGKAQAGTISAATTALYNQLQVQVYNQGTTGSASCAATASPGVAPATPGGTQVVGSSDGFVTLTGATLSNLSFVPARYAKSSSPAQITETRYLCVRVRLPNDINVVQSGQTLSGVSTGFSLTFSAVGSRT